MSNPRKLLGPIALACILLFYVFKNNYIGGHLRKSELHEWLQKYRKRNNGLVIYNRIGKCGSTSMLRLLDALEKNGQLNSWHLPIQYWGHSGANTLARWLKKYEDALGKVKKSGNKATYVLDGHAAWIDFEAHGFSQPIYINVLRDPVSRLQSIFYYMHSPTRHGSGKSAKFLAGLFGDDKYDPKNHTLSKCLLVKKCFEFVRYKYAEQPIRQFSEMIGVDRPHAPFPLDSASLSAALTILEEEYLAVIILDELESGLLLFECLMPKQFKGALHSYQHASEKEQHANTNEAGTKPEDEDLEPILRLVTGTGEVELYNRAVRKFCLTWKEAQKICPSLPQKIPEICKKPAMNGYVEAA